MARGAAAAEQLRIAEAALAAGRFPEAAEALRKTVHLDPDSPHPRLMLAYALWRSEQREQAILVLRRLIERSPGNADAWFNLGNFYRAERQFEDAVRAFGRAAQLQPGNAALRAFTGSRSTTTRESSPALGSGYAAFTTLAMPMMAFSSPV